MQGTEAGLLRLCMHPKAHSAALHAPSARVLARRPCEDCCRPVSYIRATHSGYCISIAHVSLTRRQPATPAARQLSSWSPQTPACAAASPAAATASKRALVEMQASNQIISTILMHLCRMQSHACPHINVECFTQNCAVSFPHSHPLAVAHPLPCPLTLPFYPLCPSPSCLPVFTPTLPQPLAPAAGTPAVPEVHTTVPEPPGHQVAALLHSAPSAHCSFHLSATPAHAPSAAAGGYCHQTPKHGCCCRCRVGRCSTGAAGRPACLSAWGASTAAATHRTSPAHHTGCYCCCCCYHPAVLLLPQPLS